MAFLLGINISGAIAPLMHGAVSATRWILASTKFKGWHILPPCITIAPEILVAKIDI